MQQHAKANDLAHRIRRITVLDKRYDVRGASQALRQRIILQDSCDASDAKPMRPSGAYRDGEVPDRSRVRVGPDEPKEHGSSHLELSHEALE
jgi:hypothetical protein